MRCVACDSLGLLLTVWGTLCWALEVFAPLAVLPECRDVRRGMDEAVLCKNPPKLFWFFTFSQLAVIIASAGFVAYYVREGKLVRARVNMALTTCIALAAGFLSFQQLLDLSTVVTSEEGAAMRSFALNGLVEDQGEAQLGTVGYLLHVCGMFGLTIFNVLLSSIAAIAVMQAMLSSGKEEEREYELRLLEVTDVEQCIRQ